MSNIRYLQLDPRQIAVDAGGLMRVNQTTLADGKILNADNPWVWENAGTGSGTFSGNTYNMSVASGQWRVRQLDRRLPYFSGKSQRIEETFDSFAPQANVVKRFGYFSSNAVSPFDSNFDGFWLESGGGTITLNVARSGTFTLNAKDITEWSGYANLAEYQDVANWDNFTVCEFKFLWLGGAVLILSVKTSRGFVEAHRFDYAGTAQNIFITSPNQPLRYEIRSTTGAGSFRYICSQVASEGSIDESGESIAYDGSKVDADAVDTIYVLCGFKKQTAYRDTAIQIVSIGVANAGLTTDAGILQLYINPTLSGALTYSNYGRFQAASGGGVTVTAGTGRKIAATPASIAGVSDVLTKNYLAWLSSTLNDTHDEYILAYKSITANQDVYGVVNLKEY